MGLVKIRKKYRFDFCVLNIEEDIPYTNIPQIITGFADFLIISKIFHGKNGEESFKIIHYAFVTPMEYIWRLDTLATAIPLVTSPENSSIEGTNVRQMSNPEMTRIAWFYLIYRYPMNLLVFCL